MTNRSSAALFDTTSSALQLPRSAPGSRVSRKILSQAPNTNLDKNFWLLRELGRYLVIVDPSAAWFNLGSAAEEGLST